MSAVAETSLQEIAKEYQQLGLCTIPVEGKRPAVSWRPFVERFPTTDEWQNFPWREASGLALVIGPSTWELWPNLWCLDIEAEHRSDAEAWLDRYVPDWRAGAVVETGSGGLHVYFLADRPVRTRPIPWGEVRGLASICVLPPSRHPETGRPYQWLSQRWSNLPLLNPDRIPGGTNGHQPVRELVSETIPVGSRHDTMVRVAGLARGELRLEPEEILRVLEAVNERCEVPLPSDELRAIAYSTTHWKTNPQLIIRDRRSAPPRTPITFAGRQPPPPRDWLVADVVPAGLPVILYGAGGSAKSYLVLLLGICVASGLPWLGKPTLRRPVLYADFELDETEHHRRAIRLASGLGLPDVPADFYYVSLPDLRPEDADAVLARWIADHPDGLVIIDSLGPAAVEIEHEKALPIVQLFQRLRLLNPGGLVLVDHQSKLQAGQDYRDKAPFGSVYKFNLSRVIWQVECVTSQPGEAWLIVRNTKNNLGPLQGELGVKLTFGEERIEVSVVPVTSSVLLERASLESRILATLETHGPLTAQEIADQLEANPGSVKAKLSRLKGLGRVHVVGTVGREYLWSLPGQSDNPSLTTEVTVNDDQKPDNWLQDAKCPVFQSSLTALTHMVVNVNDDPEKPDISHHDAKCPVFDHVADTKAFGVNNGKPDIFDHDAKIALCEPAVVTEKPDISRHEAKIALCEVCGRPVTWSGRGKPARYCSDACRKKAQRKGDPGQRSENDDQRVPIVNVNAVNVVNVNDRPERVHCNPEELDDEAVIALCQQLLDHGPLPARLDIPGGHIFDPRRFLTTQLGDAKGTGYVAQIARHHLRTFLHVLWSGDSSQHPESLATTTGKSQATVPSDGTPGHSSHQGNLVGDQATVPSTRVSGQISPGHSQATVPSDEGPRCPVCGEVYQLRTTDRPGWLQIRCRCRRPNEWWWVREGDPALGGKGVTQHGSG